MQCIKYDASSGFTRGPLLRIAIASRQMWINYNVVRFTRVYRVESGHESSDEEQRIPKVKSFFSSFAYDLIHNLPNDDDNNNNLFINPIQNCPLSYRQTWLAGWLTSSLRRHIRATHRNLSFELHFTNLSASQTKWAYFSAF